MASSSMAKPNGTLNYFPSHVQDFPMIASVSITPRFSEVCPSSLNFTFNRTANASRLPIIRAHVSPDYVPDAKFYKVEAILRPWRIPQVSAALLKMGIRGVTVSDVRGFGAQGGLTERQAVVPVSDVIRVRTGERGEMAERMMGERTDMSSPATST
ncbi:nitrogen regulatory protein P-II homolog isoform X1 [Olea europaea var. sylvestris]|uniref:nitrogen regulatory protein P-II homolog isoform X1 n=1 Tax=Olea europaea var. sylvestris TaxID=158386 RepID=UPI000C1D3B91|nr:nitrogen regulatory protein P-II homolog isoform X1 [Olea europaea var. sylvestris]